MNKKFAAAGMTTLLVTSLATCSSSFPASADEKLNIETVVNVESDLSIESLVESAIEKQKQLKLQTQIQTNTINMNNALDKLKKYVGKTWYVFSGSTPSGWDCSGLVMWTYQQLDVELYHRASVQKNSGKKVKESQAKPGDIVAFGWTGWNGAGHVGIYVGNGMMIHSPAPGKVTTLQSVESFSKGYSKVTYTRILETN